MARLFKLDLKGTLDLKVFLYGHARTSLHKLKLAQIASTSAKPPQSLKQLILSETRLRQEEKLCEKIKLAEDRIACLMMVCRVLHSRNTNASKLVKKLKLLMSIQS